MQSINKYYLVGIKGTGMSSLAKLLKEEGNEVVGSDVDEYYFTEDALKEQKIEIKSFNRVNITKDYFYIIGNAFDKNNVEVDEIINQKMTGRKTGYGACLLAARLLSTKK